MSDEQITQTAAATAPAAAAPLARAGRAGGGRQGGARCRRGRRGRRAAPGTWNRGPAPPPAQAELTPVPAPARGADTIPQIEHIVVLMMENHSYDNRLGMLEPATVPTVSRLGHGGLPTATNPYVKR